MDKLRGRISAVVSARFLGFSSMSPFDFFPSLMKRGGKMTFGLRSVSQMTILSYRRKKMRTLHLYLYIRSQKHHTSHNPFRVLGLSRLFMMVLMYHFQDRKRKPSHCADSFIAGRQISEVLS